MFFSTVPEILTTFITWGQRSLVTATWPICTLRTCSRSANSPMTWQKTTQSRAVSCSARGFTRTRSCVWSLKALRPILSCFETSTTTGVWKIPLVRWWKWTIMTSSHTRWTSGERQARACEKSRGITGPSPANWKWSGQNKSKNLLYVGRFAACLLYLF